MLQLPKINRDPKQTSKLCGCRPICKSRRREWKGTLQDTSAEQFLDRKPTPECFRRCPTKVFPNSPCPLFGRTRRVTLVRRNSHLTPEVVRICQAPLDDTVDTTYLKYAALAKSIGAWGAVRTCCAFCKCGCCCPCTRAEYEPRDADRAGTARRDMRRYDARVGRTYQEMRTMYDKIETEIEPYSLAVVEYQQELPLEHGTSLAWHSAAGAPQSQRGTMAPHNTLFIYFGIYLLFVVAFSAILCLVCLIILLWYNRRYNLDLDPTRDPKETTPITKPRPEPMVY